MLPAAPAHAWSPRNSMDTFDPIPRRQTATAELPRSASSADVTRDGEALNSDLRRTNSEHVLSLPPDRTIKTNGTGYVANKELFRRASRKAKNKLGGARFSLPSDNENGGSTTRELSQPDIESEPTKGVSRSVTGTIRSLARKSFLSPSRSPSPAPAAAEPRSMEKKRSRSPFKKNSITVAEIISVPAAVHSRNSSRSSQVTVDVPTKPEISATRRTSSLIGPTRIMNLKNKSENDLTLRRKPSNFSLRSRSSVEQFTSSIKVPPIPSSMSTDRLSTTSLDNNKKKDALWAAFRALDGDYLK